MIYIYKILPFLRTIESRPDLLGLVESAVLEEGNLGECFSSNIVL